MNTYEHDDTETTMKAVIPSTISFPTTLGSKTSLMLKLSKGERKADPDSVFAAGGNVSKDEVHV